MFRFACLAAFAVFAGFVAAPVFAQDHTPEYQKAVLVGFKTVTDGASCSSTGSVSAIDDRSVNAQTSCSDSRIRVYTVQVGTQTFFLEPTRTGKQSAKQTALVVGTLGYGALFVRKKDVMANQLPGATLLIRSAGKGFQIKVGNKESVYLLLGAE